MQRACKFSMILFNSRSDSSQLGAGAASNKKSACHARRSAYVSGKGGRRRRYADDCRDGDGTVAACVFTRKGGSMGSTRLDGVGCLGFLGRTATNLTYAVVVVVVAVIFSSRSCEEGTNFQVE